MGANTAPQKWVLVPGEVRNFKVSFADELDAGELLASVSAVAEQTTSNLTISNEAVNTAALTINNATVPIGKAVQCKITGQVVNISYSVKVTVVTDSTPAQTLIGYIEFDCRAR